MKLGFKRGEKGFTLVELMVVMAIIAILATIVVPAVSGTKEVGADSQVKQDASVAGGAVSSYYSDQTAAEIFTTNTTNAIGAATNQIISTRWPETYLTQGYSAEFPTTNATVTKVNIKDTSSTNISEVTLANGWNVIDLAKLVDQKYIPVVPAGASGKSGNFHNYLWLVKKTSAAAEAGATVESRTVQIFKLDKVIQTGATYELFYIQIY